MLQVNATGSFHAETRSGNALTIAWQLTHYHSGFPSKIKYPFDRLALSPWESN